MSRKGTRSGVSKVFPYITSRVVTFRGNRRTYLLEKAVEVNVHNVPGVRIHEDVFKVTIAETTIRVNRLSWGKIMTTIPKDESDDRHNRRSSTVGQATRQPYRRFWEGLQEPYVENGWEPIPRFTFSVQTRRQSCTNCLRTSTWNISATSFGDSAPFIRPNACASSVL